MQQRKTVNMYLEQIQQNLCFPKDKFVKDKIHI